MCIISCDFKKPECLKCIPQALKGLSNIFVLVVLGCFAYLMCNQEQQMKRLTNRDYDAGMVHDKL